MEQYLNKEVKKIISEFPRVADLLNAYDIGCVNCSVGNCLLKDIITIHNLTMEQEKEIMQKIKEIVTCGNETSLAMPANTEAPQKQIKYSPAIKKLVDEHILIKRWLELIPNVIEQINFGYDEELIVNGIDFIKSYADKFHHAKEEDILFKYFDENSEIIKTMLNDHTAARSYVKAVLEAISTKNKKIIVEHLNKYKELLAQHMKIEDEILYPWIQRNLSSEQLNQLFAKFEKIDREFKNKIIKYEKFITILEQKRSVLK